MLDEQKKIVRFYRENTRYRRTLTWSNPGVVCSLSESTFVVPKSQEGSGKESSLVRQGSGHSTEALGEGGPGCSGCSRYRGDTSTH